ncbi:MAG: hypothetical protein M1830_007716 [Pleopsidium flavum]|nr:MAG: hypothetical protein M1830_007716 [Pleopsidium flavum]
MGRIKKAAGPKQAATLGTPQSPALSEFVITAVKVPLSQLPPQIRSFPRTWPFPRGDLYHWIPLLNRFDDILEQFNAEYGLHTGPQTQPFERRLLIKGAADNEKVLEASGTSANELEVVGSGPEGDRELVEVILDFSRVLLENCGNRSLYSSSERLDGLLNTTSTSLLSCTLRLATRLAQRYHASRQRGAGAMQHVNNALLASHYNINLEKVQKLALPFTKSDPPTSAGATSAPATTPTAKGKEKALSQNLRRPSSGASVLASDMISMVKDSAATNASSNGTVGAGSRRLPSETAWDNWGGVWLTYYENQQASGDESRKFDTPGTVTGPLSSTPATPTPARRNSGLGLHQTSRSSRLSNSDEVGISLPASGANKAEEPSPGGVKILEIAYAKISTVPLHEIMRTTLPDIPQDYHFELLNRVRVAYALSKSVLTRREMLAIRILAITNLAYIYPESMFQQKVLQQDSDEPRRLQLTYQLAELVHPPGNGDSNIPRALQTLAFGALEALAKHKSKAPDVCAALSVNVNHGVLLYITRKAVTEMAVEDPHVEDSDGDDWREALFSLLSTLPSSTPRAGESMVAAGLIQILVEVLTLRTNKAERNHTKVMNLFDSLVYQVREAFQTLANAKGLDILADLTAYEVESALQRADNGEGMPSAYRTQVIDYQIPYFQQQTLRWLFKFVNHMMQHGGANFDRLLRNLIDSPQLLSALRVVLGNAKVFGSNVWSGAVNILSSFIHNEPTSYAVIAEAGLSKGFLEAVTMRTINVPEKPKENEEASQAGDPQMTSADGTERTIEHHDIDASGVAFGGSVPDEPKPRRFKVLSARNGPLAQGVLPATDAIATIPTAFGAICLNSTGMELFKASDALDSFFEIFESPEHVKCMTLEGDLPALLGRTFDELIRHHPPLKVPVMSSVMIMIARVGMLCNLKARDSGLGAKLWVEGEDGQNTVAGGNKALLGEMFGASAAQSTGSEKTQVDYGEDVNMEVDHPLGASSSDPVTTIDQSVTGQNILQKDKEGPSVADYVMVAVRFLAGIFENPSHCSAFVEAGGLENVLDFATLPSLQYDFNNQAASQELARVVHMMAEQKPHLVLPSLIRRTQIVADRLEPLTSHQDGSAFFAGLTASGKSELGHQRQEVRELVEANGTLFVKALVAVHTLCNILYETFSQPVFNHRSSHTPFSQVNLADMYAALVKSLGRLHRACVWEEIMLQKSIPESWKDATRIKGYGIGSQEADEILGLLHEDHTDPEPIETAVARTEPDVTAEGTFAQLPTNGNVESPTKDSKASITQDQKTAQFKNVQTLRYLLSQIPSSITPFFQGLGKVLVAKRRPDGYQRQNAYMVADALAEATLNQLRFQAAEKSASVQDRYSYWIVVLTSISQLLIEGPLERPHAQCLTLVLQAFKNHGGLDAIKDILIIFFDEVKSFGSIGEDLPTSNDVSARLAAAYGGIKIILTLYSQITNPKYIVEATQTTVIANDRDREKADYFSPAQFLVELRMTVLPVVRSIWESDFVDKASSSIVKCLIEILRTVLEGEHEHGAFKRSDKAPVRAKATPRPFTFHSDRVSTLKDKGFEEVLAREALYRCNNNLSYAEEYCDAQQLHELPNPIPIYENQKSPPQSRSPPRRRDSDATLPDIGNGAEPAQPRIAPPVAAPEESVPGHVPHVEVEEAEGEEIPGTSMAPPPPAPGVPSEPNGAEGDELLPMSIDNLLNLIEIPRADEQRAGSAASPNVTSESLEKGGEMETPKSPETVTVDDLDSERSGIRMCLIDRSLDVINVHSDVTFELADLITAAVAKAGDPASMRREIGETLVQSLISLQMDEDFRPEGKKIAAYANLLALVLQDKDFYDATLDELKDNFATLLGFIKIFSDQAAEETSPWIGQILLIIEKMLAEDAQPQQIKWTPPSSDDPRAASPIAELEGSVIPIDEKFALFEAVVEILPRIGKDESLALSVIRVLVILTRHRQLAVKLGEKRNMQRLFVMVKQLAGMTNEKLQSAFMLVLRHVIEDEDSIRQIMRSEIIASFEPRSSRQTDTTGYVRQMYHLVLRAPEIFVEVTNEKLKLQRFDSSQRPQLLSLRTEDKAENLPTQALLDVVPDGEASSANDQQPAELGKTDDVKPSAEQQTTETTEKAKAIDVKAPVVEHPDGVIHYLLCELLSYKDVEERDPSVNVKDTTKGLKPTPQVDIDMTNGDALPTSPLSNPTSSAEGKEGKKEEFKADQHPIYIYRCFLLQCLTELLSSYNRTKIEFINFSRKADPQAITPSKPRSGVLNYLLNAVIPVGTLNHEESISFRKKNTMSSWAMSAIVALCSKTGEKGHERHRDLADNVDEPDLLFVRKFVLEHALKAYKDANSSAEALDLKYSHMLCITDLFNQMLTSRPYHGGTATNAEIHTVPQKQIARIMFEKNFISALTSSIADIDLNFPGSKRVVKYILRPLKQLTQAAITLSETSSLTTNSGHTDDDEISTASSVSDMDDDREETPDLFRNSTLGMFEPGREEESSSESSEGDEEMYNDEYGDEMEYEEDLPGDNGDVVSEEDEDIEGTGHIEGLPGDVGMDVEVVIDGDEDDDPSDEDDEDDEDDSEDMEDGNEIEIIDEINGDAENGSLAEGEDDEWQSEIDEGDGYEGVDDMENDLSQDPDQDHHLQEIVRAIEGEPQDVLERLERGDLEMEMEAEGYMEDAVHDEEEDEEDEEDTEEQDLMYEPGFEVNFDTYFDTGDEDPGMPNMPWDWDTDEPPPPLPRSHHHHHHRLPSPWTIFPGGPPDRGINVATYRSHRPVGATRGTDDGTNPLLQRNNRNGAGSGIGRAGRSGAGAYLALSDWVHAMEPGHPGRGLLPADSPVSFMNNIISAIGQGGPFGPLGHRHGGLHLHVAGAPRGLLPRELQAMLGLRRSQPDASRPSRDDPSQAVNFVPAGTTTRWQEEARLLYGNSYVEKTQRLVNSLLRVLVPPAMEEEKVRKEKAAEEARKLKEERERKLEEERTAKEQVEKEAQEKREQEEHEAAEAAQAATRAQGEGQEQGDEAGPEEPNSEGAMEGVEQTQAESAPPPSSETAELLTTEIGVAEAESSEPATRVRTTIRGRELDITGMDIDPEYLEALPEELREEVLMHQLAEQRSQAAAAGEEPTDISREFLEALPPDIREELLQQEAQDRRRREREEHRRRAAANGGTPAARGEEMDPASFLASLDPTLRQAVLMEQDEDVLAQLPQAIAAEARALGGDRRLHQFMDMPRINRSRGLDRGDRGGNQATKKPQRRQIVQMLDKAGVATLLRLMFIPQQGSARQCLNGILHDVCENRQNRAEVVSLLLSILQDGSADINAIDRSFQQLSLRAKQPATQKTPQLKRTLTGQTPPQANTEMTPLMVVQQCLSALVFLTQYNPHIPSFFLTEHETSPGLKSKSSRKGKAKENKAQKYALNALLSLLDRKLIMESSNCMELLSTLLNSITHPLTMLLKKDKEKAGEPSETENPSANLGPDAAAAEQTADDSTLHSIEATPNEDTNMAGSTASVATVTTDQPVVEETAVEEPVDGVAASTSEPKPEPKEATEDDKAKKQRTLMPPVVPEYNLRLVINILAARECSAKTFRDTLSTINNLSAIPEAKVVFGKELIKQAQELGESILNDLDDLVTQIKEAGAASDIQGMALARFSLASSDQAKLLRVLTALDYLFDPKRNGGKTTSAGSATGINGEASQIKDNLLTTLYENSTFGPLWTKLSECLSTIRSRDSMLNVATILLPLIEALMVVCKNTTLKDAPLMKVQKEFAVTSPPPESRMENLFFNFTEEHRKILNDLVRHNPKLMSGTFSLLVKNPKVLEFDNKRNYFSRRLHSRGTEARHPQPPLQLAVRRDQVFLDSFKSLYFKTGDEMKYGKLSIRFHGEEGVDAGGVTREWFQVLSRQMFNPDYALFTPVASDRTTFHPNRLSSVNPEHFMFFKFIGRVIGKALYEGRVLDCHFSRAVYKRILGKTVSIKDMETLDLDYYKSLVWMLENDITDIITENFSVETEAFGETQIIDLVENGRNIPVTEENKQEYVQLVVEYRLTGSVREQLENFLKGFHDVVPAELISIFDEQELELLISGLPDIDVDDWKNNTEYHNYSASSSQIQWFWRAVRSFDKEERAKLLQFVTGTSKVPLNGFKELEGMNGFSRFNIHRDYGNKDRLPSSHTCFNQLDLPEYESYEALRQQVYTAMTAGSEYFGFA